MTYTDILCALRANYAQGRKVCVRTTLDRLKANGLCPKNPKADEIQPVHAVLIALGALGHVFVSPKVLASNAQSFADAGAMVAGEMPLAPVSIHYQRLNGPLNSLESITITPELLGILANEWEYRHGAKLIH